MPRPWKTLKSTINTIRRRKPLLSDQSSTVSLLADSPPRYSLEAPLQLTGLDIFIQPTNLGAHAHYTIATTTTTTATACSAARRRVNALEIPEILARVGHFIPQWTTHIACRFSPRQILQCTQVCRLWYNVLYPLVWQAFDDSIMQYIPIGVIRLNANWIRVLDHRHNFKVNNAFANCQNLVQLTLSPWVTEADILLKSNKRLVKICWLSSKEFSFSISDTNLEAISQLSRLEELHFSGCKLDHRKLLMVLAALGQKTRSRNGGGGVGGGDGLVTLKLSNVVFFDQQQQEKEEEEEEDELQLANNINNIHNNNNNKLPDQVPLKELQISQLLVHQPGFLAFVERCKALEKLQIEGDSGDGGSSGGDGDNTSTTVERKHLKLQDCLVKHCPRLKSFQYKTDKLVSWSIEPVFLPDKAVMGYIQTIRATESESASGFVSSLSSPSEAASQKRVGSDPIDDNDLTVQGWRRRPTIGFKLDSISLSIEVTTAANSLQYLNTLELNLFGIKHSYSSTSVMNDLRNSVLILTTCQHLQIFKVEYENLFQLKEPMLSLDQACFLFHQPWACTKLERFAYSGIKRFVTQQQRAALPSSRVGMRGVIVVDRFDAANDVYVPIKMSDLLMDVKRSACEWMLATTPNSEAIRRQKRQQQQRQQSGFSSTLSSRETILASDEMYEDTTILQDIQEFQDKLFTQVKLLKHLRVLSFNGEERTDFSGFV
ncbi:hypothetical protein BG004_003298 [Podila humilis]|nr:hypothetical protein BG004_003298 [Podila humilis]